jgi:putative transposase
MNSIPEKVRWPHAPPHFMVGSGTFMVTASTYGRSHHFGSRKRLRFLSNLILETAERFEW